jgi:putative photosynthetic complex assembly protein
MTTSAMPRRRAEEKIPRVLVRGIIAMVLASIALTTFARVTGMPPAAMPPDGRTEVVAERLIQIMGSLDASATVWDTDGTVIADLGPMEAGFISGVHRALTRERMLAKVEGNPPVRLVRFADGRLGLRDPETGWRVELIGFGDTNHAAFLALLD